MIFTATSTVASTIDPNVLTPGQIPMIIELMAKAFNSGSWTLASGLLLSLVVLAMRMFKVVQKVPKKWMPWAVAGTSLLASVAVGLQTNQGWWQILSTGFAVALVAVGGSETLLKSLREMLESKGVIPKTEEKAPEPKEEPKEEPEEEKATEEEPKAEEPKAEEEKAEE